MLLGIILFTGGLVIILGLFLWARQRQELGYIPTEEQQAVMNLPLASSDDAVLVSKGHGQLVYANERARHWVGMNGGDPNLEFIAQMAQPTDSFLELFAGEGQASFQLGSRWVEASSHTIPSGQETRTVIVMRELSANTSHPEALDLSLAMMTINEMGETINVSMSMEQVYQALLAIVMKAVPAAAGEICIWDGNHRILHPRGWVGTSDYLLALSEFGGSYKIGEGITGWIAQHRKPVLVTNIKDTTAVQPKLSEFYKSFVGVPLMLGSRFIGTFELGDTKPGRFGQADMALLQAVSKQVAISIYNAELYSEQSRRIKDMASLQEITRQQETITDTRPIYKALNERIGRLISASQCGIYLYDENRRALVPELPFYGLPDPVIRGAIIALPPDSPQRDIWENQPYWVTNDADDEPLVEALGLKGLFSAAGIRSTALIPLAIGNHRIGMMQVSNKLAEGGFTSNDITELRMLGAQAAIVVENVRLYQQEQRRESELIGLQEITHAIGALSDEGEFFANITERIANLMGISMCGILLYNEENHSLMSQLPFYGIEDAVIRNYQITLEPGSPLRAIWDEEDTWFTNQAQTSAVVYEAGLADFAAAMGVNKTLLAAMSVGGRKLGIVQASNKINGEDFTEKDARLLLIFATQAAAMVENARLYREMARGAQEATSLRNVAELAGKILTADDSFMPVLAEVAKLMDSPLVYINVLDSQTGSLITYPRYLYGMELHEPIVQDIYSKGFQNSVAMSHEAFVSNDIARDKRVLEGYRNIAQKTSINSTVLVPLIIGDTSLGELGVANRDGKPYGEDDERMMTAIAAQLAATIERLRLYEAAGQNLNRRLQELDAISKISNELTQTLELDPVLEAIRHEAARATRADSGTIILLRPQSTWQDPTMPELEKRLGDKNVMPGIADIELEAIMRGADTVLVSDYATSANMRPLPSNARSSIAAAFLFEDEVVGVIHLYHTRPNNFDERAAAFLLTLAAKASLGYGNYKRYRDQLDRSARLNKRVEQLNRIFELGQKLQASSDHVTMLEDILDGIQQSVGFDTSIVALSDDDAGVLRRVAQVGLPLDVFEQSKDNVLSIAELQTLFREEHRISESYFLPTQQRKKWSKINLSALDADFGGKRTLGKSGDSKQWHEGDMLLVPLYGAGNNLLGVISLDRPQDNTRPDRNTVEILEIFSHQAASTIENMRLYLASLQNAEQEARLNEIMEAIASTLDTGEIVEAIAHGSLRLVPFNQMTVALLNPEQQGFDVIKVTINNDSSLVINKEYRPYMDNTALARVFESGEEHIYYADSPEGEQYEDLRAWRANGEQSSLIVPLLAGGVCLGAMHLGSELEQAVGFNEYLPLIKRMANLAAVAMQNARLFNQALNLRVFNESVLESIQQGIVVLDKSGRILSVNDYMRQRYSWDPKVALRQDLFAYRPNLAQFLAEDVRAVLDGTSERGERIGQNSYDEQNKLLVRNFYTYPLRSGENIRGAVVLVEDVTDRAMLEKDVETRANQLAVLTEVSSRITATLNREDVVNLALDEMGRIIKYDAMTLWSRNGEKLDLEGSSGFNEDVAMVPDDVAHIKIASHQRLRTLVETRQPFSISHLQGLDPLPGENGTQSWLGVPLVNQGDVVGVIALAKEEPHFYDEQAEQAAFAFANQVAVALANARLYAQAEYRNDRLTLLNRVSISLAQSLDSENILEIGLREISQALKIGHARALVFERDVQIARVIVVHPRGDTPPDEIINLNDSAIFQAIRRTASALIYEDVELMAASDPVAQELKPRGVKAYVMIPMTVGGQVIGAYEMEVYDGPRRFNAEQVDLGLIIANQSAIAVQNTSLLEQTLVRTRELETLLEAAQATSLTLSLSEAIRSVSELILHALEMDDCAVMLWDTVENSLEVQIDLNRFGDMDIIAPKGTQYNLRRFPSKSRALQEREIIVIRAEDDQADPSELDELRRLGDTFRVLIPLAVRDQSIGLIQAEVNAPHRIFAHREMRLGQALGAQSAIAIQNARLSTETAALVEEGFIINNLSQAIASTLTIDDMVLIVRDQVPRVTEATELYLALYDPDTDIITFPMAVRHGEDFEIEPRKLNTDEVSFVIRHRRSLSLGGGNWSSDDMRRNLGISNGEGDVKSYLGVPVKSGDQMIGVLAVRDPDNSRAFGINDERLLTTVGTQLGAAMQNARLFNQVSNFAEDLNRLVKERTQELQQERDRIDTLYRITSELARTLDMDRILNRGLEMVVDAVKANDGAIMLIDPLSDNLYTRAAFRESKDSTYHPAQKLATWLLHNDRMIVVDDLSKQDYWDAKAPGAQGIRSALAVLLESGDDPQGVMVLLSDKPAAFSETQSKLVVAAATQVASAINNADLYHLIRDQAERLGMLLRTEQEEAEKNSAIVEGIADGVLLADSDGIIIQFNSAAERILDLPRDNVVGQTLFKLTGLFGGSGSKWAQAIHDWAQDPERHPAGAFLEERLDLGKRVVSVHLSPVHIGERFLGTVSVFRDITKEVEVDRIKSEFVSNVSHELRTPMTSIKGFADLLLMGVVGLPTEPQKGFLLKIKANADRLSQLVDDLLNISKIDAGERLNLELVEVGPIINNVVSTLEAKTEHQRKNMKVTVDIAPLLPPIKGDPQKLTQIINNIVDNAFNYTSAGGSIDIKAHEEGDRILISVKDTGIGIPEEFRSRIWQRFERYDEHALVMDVAGTGLGLSIVKELVAMHNGDVWFESELGKGSTFFISLPIDQPDYSLN
jgi:PAS domain S-box-containing protein